VTGVSASFVGDAGAWASLIIPIFTFLVVLIQRLTRLLDKVDDLTATTTSLSEVVDDAADATAETQRIVRHHLGPNGDTTPIRARLSQLERANGITPPVDGG
jgi:hypothetical protein